jgi:hypothetical protein
MRTSLVALLLVTLSGCTTTERSPSRAESSAPVQPSPPSSVAASPVPPGGTSAEAAIQFVLNDTYTVGDTARVRVKNVGDRPYRYELYYAACRLHYFDSEGRRFIIPPGTHCDLIAYGTIKPGETELLFKWNLDECVKDAWGCVRSRPLSPGTYTITGAFKPKNAGNSVSASSSFELLPSD